MHGPSKSAVLINAPRLAPDLSVSDRPHPDNFAAAGPRDPDNFDNFAKVAIRP
jgi:hypothetical protein